MPRWQVARMWLGGSVSRFVTEALWALMHINEIGCCHIPTHTQVLQFRIRLLRSIHTEQKRKFSWMFVVFSLIFTLSLGVNGSLETKFYYFTRLTSSKSLAVGSRSGMNFSNGCLATALNDVHGNDTQSGHSDWCGNPMILKRRGITFKKNLGGGNISNTPVFLLLVTFALGFSNRVDSWLVYFVACM